MRQAGKISPSKAARLLGVNYRTVLRHITKAVHGCPSMLQSVYRDPKSGYYWLDLDEINALRTSGADHVRRVDELSA